MSDAEPPSTVCGSVMTTVFAETGAADITKADITEINIIETKLIDLILRLITPWSVY